MEFKLKDIAEFNVKSLSTKTMPSTIHYLDTSNITNGKIDNVIKLDVKYDKVPSRARRLVDADDIVYSTVRPIQKHFGFITKEISHITVSTGFVVIKPNKNLVNPYFLYCYLTTDLVTNTLQGIAENSTTAYPSIKPSDLGNLLIDLPPLNVQEFISNFIMGIDLKLKNNINIIDKLEQISQTIFKSWFIDFEFPNEEGIPYKTNGGEMIDSEIGKIPAEFRESTFDSLGTIIGGGTPSKKNEDYYTSDGIGWITPKDLSNNKNVFIYKGALDITELGLKKGSARLLPENTVLFTSRAPIGYIAIAGKIVTTNQGFKSIVPDKGYSQYFIYHLLKFKLPVIEAAAGGSTFKEISGKGLKEIIIPLPPVQLVNRYQKMVEPLFLQIQTFETKNQKLIQLRDILLPKLISGEIAIPKELEV